jgi:hypothetical protein
VPAIWLAMIERAAKDPTISIEKLERLLALRAQEEARQAAWRYREAMPACQAAMDPIRADAKNDQTRSRYATLAPVDAAARPVYTRFGFGVSFDTADTEKSDSIRVVARVYHAGGHTERHHIDMPCDGKGIKGNTMMTTTHAAASAISYARRYLLLMVFSLSIDRDDDGNNASRRPEAARPSPGRHANGDDNRFYREPSHDPQTGEVIEEETGKEFAALRDAIRRTSSAVELLEWGEQTPSA